MSSAPVNPNKQTAKQKKQKKQKKTNKQTSPIGCTFTWLGRLCTLLIQKAMLVGI